MLICSGIELKTNIWLYYLKYYLMSSEPLTQPTLPIPERFVLCALKNHSLHDLQKFSIELNEIMNILNKQLNKPICPKNRIELKTNISQCLKKDQFLC